MDSEPSPMDALICPKRSWVMTALAEVDAPVGESDIPKTIRYHLSRCDACSQSVKVLLAVSSSLAELGDLEPETALADRADHRVLAALSDGARMTGRVDIPDEPDVATTGSAAVPWRRYAVAASIVLALGAYAFVSFQLGQDGPIERSTVNQCTGITDEPAPQPAGQRLEAPSEDGPLEAVVAVGELPDSEQADDSASPIDIDKQVAGEEVVVDSVSPADSAHRRNVPVARKRRSWVCEHETVEEAALCNNPHGVHQAVVLPRRVRRNLARHPRRVDNPPRARSTTPGRGGR